MSVVRRGILKAAAGAALAAPFVRRADAAASTVAVAGMGDVFEGHYRRAVIEPFMKQNHDVRVAYFSFPASAMALGTIRAQRSSPQLDVAIMDMNIARVGTSEGLLAPLDSSRIPSLADFGASGQIVGIAGAPLTYDCVALVYSPPHVQPAPTSWRVLWQPDYKGRVVMSAPPDYTGIYFTVIANKVFGGDDFYHLQGGIAALSKLAPNVLNWNPRPDPYTFIVNGTAWLAVGWNARAQLYATQYPDKVGVAIPTEGTIRNVNTISIVKNTPRLEAAEAFVNYALAPAVQARFTDSLFYAPTNPKADALVLPAALARTVAAPAYRDRVLDVDQAKLAEQRDELTDQWRQHIL